MVGVISEASASALASATAVIYAYKYHLLFKLGLLLPDVPSSIPAKNRCFAPLYQWQNTNPRGDNEIHDEISQDGTPDGPFGAYKTLWRETNPTMFRPNLVFAAPRPPAEKVHEKWLSEP